MARQKKAILVGFILKIPLLFIINIFIIHIAVYSGMKSNFVYCCLCIFTLKEFNYFLLKSCCEYFNLQTITMFGFVLYVELVLSSCMKCD